LRVLAKSLLEWFERVAVQAKAFFFSFFFQALSQCVFNWDGFSSKSLYLNAEQK